VLLILTFVCERGICVRLSYEFRRLADGCAKKDMNIKEFIAYLGPRATALLSFVFSIPFLIFIPLPGLSMVFGIIVIFCGISIALNRPLWIPAFVNRHKFSGAILSKSLYTGEKILKVCEKWIRPRGEFIARNTWIQRINGLMIFLSGLCLTLPLPPGTNFTPGFAVFVLSVAILEEDAVFLLVGYTAFLVNIAFFTLLPMLGWEGITHLFGH